MQEQEKALRHFFRHLVSFLATSAVCVIIWLFGGLGYFWPIWVIIFMGIPLFIEAYRLRVLPKKCQERAEQAFRAFPELTAEYENTFVKNQEEKAADSSKKGTAKKTAAKKSTASTAKKKSTTTKKTATKKTTTTKTTKS